jgi:hypothetical protein
MAKYRTDRSQQQRILVAQTAARLMAEQGIQDFHAAKLKAVEQMGLDKNSQNMPRNQEVELALSEYQRLFQSDLQPKVLQRLRAIAQQLMGLLEQFQPRLVGSVLSGRATAYSNINLHLFAQTPEFVAMYLLDHGIPYEIHERKVRMGNNQYQDYPVYRFIADDVTIEAMVFDQDGLRQSPLSPVDGKPMQRAARAEVMRLLAA